MERNQEIVDRRNPLEDLVTMSNMQKLVAVYLIAPFILFLFLQPSLVSGADMQMQPSTPPSTPPSIPPSTPPSTPTAPATGSTTIKPPVSTKVIICPQSSPGCSVDKTITMTIGPNSITFSSNPTEGVTITTPYDPANPEKVKDHEQGLFTGYSLGFKDALIGKDAKPYPVADFEGAPDTKAWFDGYEQGYYFGYSAGIFANSLKKQ